MEPVGTKELTAAPSQAIHAVARLLDAALESPSAAAMHAMVVREARSLFGARTALLLSVERREGLAVVTAVEPEDAAAVLPVALDQLPGVLDVADRRTTHERLRGDQATALAHRLGQTAHQEAAVLLGLRARDDVDHVLVLLFGAGGEQGPAEDDDALEQAAAFARAAAAGLAQLRLGAEQAERGARQAALARAAKQLNEAGLDLSAVLHGICLEAREIFGGDNVAVYRGNAEAGLTVDAAIGAQTLGLHMAAGQGLSGRVVQTGRAMLTNDYQRTATPADDSPFAPVQACLSVPLRWDGELQGAISVGFTRPRLVTEDDLALLETFGELAAAACRNASAAAGLALAARTDGLTGCLNHAALHEALKREVDRAERTGQPLTVVLLDLDDFKSVNEREGHLVGDEVLRRVGRALRLAVRPYDIVARYGGDEFAIVALDSDEPGAEELAARAIARIEEALDPLGLASGTVATAGIAQRGGEQDLDAVLQAADRALLYGKQVVGRGVAVCSSAVAPSFRPMATRLPRDPEPARDPVPAAPVRGGWTGAAAGAESERLQKRTRHLAIAHALGNRLAAMTDVDAIAEVVVDELHRAFGYSLCAAVRIRDDDLVEVAAARGEAFVVALSAGWSQPRDGGVIGRALREGHVVLVDDVRSDPAYTSTRTTQGAACELVAPIWAGERLWGALDLEGADVAAFDQDDARLLQTVADQMGSALRGALLYEQLERAYVGTAQALAAALEAKDSYTAQHAHSIVEWADAVGALLGMDDAARRDLRYGAIFHDIGKIAVPEAILNKQGPLDAAEWAIVQRHTVVGEQILAPVEFLKGVLPIVRHEHERFDGQGYPDGLRGAGIPLGARIVFVCDAFHAMTSDRPYRAAMAREAAIAELRAAAGRQFDPDVVVAFLEVVGEGRRDIVGSMDRRGASYAHWLQDRTIPLLGGLIDATPTAVAISDATAEDLPLVYVNPAFEEMTGYAAADVLGRNCRFLQGPETEADRVQEMREALAAGERCTLTVTNHRADGSTFCNRLTLSPVPDDGGATVQWMGTMADVTPQVDDRRRLEAAEARLPGHRRDLPAVAYEWELQDGRPQLLYVSPAGRSAGRLPGQRLGPARGLLAQPRPPGRPGPGAGRPAAALLRRRVLSTWSTASSAPTAASCGCGTSTPRCSREGASWSTSPSAGAWSSGCTAAKPCSGRSSAPWTRGC